MRLFTLLLGSIALMTASSISSPASAQDPENTLYLDVAYGRVTIEMLPDVAPKHVAQIKTLVRKGFYDGIVWHRVIDGFMAQTGDPTGTGMGGSDLPDIPAEFNKENFGRGAVGMARSANPNSGNSQFFVCFADCSFLNGQYTVWGKVTSGMEFIDQIKRGEPPASPDKIIKMTVAADAVKTAPSEAAPPAAAAQ